MAATERTLGWIGVDLDATLAHYDHYEEGAPIGEPIMPMVFHVRRWIAQGRDVRIFTARATDMSFFEMTQIQQWCRQHLGKVLPITCEKDQNMDELYDDRCVQVEPNTGKIIGYSRRGLV